MHPLISHLLSSSSKQDDGGPPLGRGQDHRHSRGRGHDIGLGDIVLVPCPRQGLLAHQIVEKIWRGLHDGRMTQGHPVTIAVARLATSDARRGAGVADVITDKENGAKAVEVSRRHGRSLVQRGPSGLLLLTGRESDVQIATLIQRLHRRMKGSLMSNQ